MRHGTSVIVVTCTLLFAVGCSDDDGAGNNNNGNSNGNGVCGDGHLDPTEECDEGALNSDIAPDACRTNCRAARCGDDVIDDGEECDASNLDGATCGTRGFTKGNLTCTSGCVYDESDCTTCGDNLAEDGVTGGAGRESCDGSDLREMDCVALGRSTGTLACSETCEWDFDGCTGVSTCGNYAVEAGEQCDDGNTTGCDGCSPSCQWETCGNGLRECDEECDLGASNSDAPDASCRTDCTPKRCGDGIVDTGEECDEGASNSNAPDAACRTDCTPTRCGDGIVDTGEVCDEGANNSNAPDSSCRTNCFPSGCGDDILDSGEECDGTVLGGETCASHGFTEGGALACASNCVIDLGGCDCLDGDGDGYGLRCALGEDCDDSAPGITGACQANGCPQGWAHVPAGNFEMGCQSGELGGTCLSSEQPRHTVTMSAYCIEVTEVSVAAYRACVDAGVCTGGQGPRDNTQNSLCNWTTGAGSLEAQPINCIDWADSSQYCQQWLGGDLPSEAQWEKAARGGPGDTRKYPWGATPEPDCTLANFDLNGGGTGGWGCTSVTSGPVTWEVGYLSGGAGDSPYGLRDMAGNVWEWGLDWYSDTFYQQCTGGCTDPVNTATATARVIRGGSIISEPWEVGVVQRNSTGIPTGRQFYIGLRCAKSF